MKKEKKSTGNFSNFGFSTILLAFAMVSIVTFATLALITAKSDYNLSQKVAEKNDLYYSAADKAYVRLSQIDAILSDSYHSTDTEEDFVKSTYSSLNSLELDSVSRDNNSIECSFSESLSDNQTLVVSILIKYPDTKSTPFYSITQWQTFTDTTVEDSALNLLGKNN